ncbi:hypothetical protein ASPNIDRAFT_38881 [Aspergillus niger ATCC 1015]|uniref:Uncharacterized protein n=1 Tax=Aspergillus niger (strain ATCC 1015 / CBS 113.46 / FGSC A1144 / LSHB Ac4 / NCTC 3858a / NRRL 328 / USDA 3528.7) TaxID=380704 RepID=G3YCD2_ASPNA|nr:hypothetical protein ASPNIDRAFT_38881 [Aspergillus niger ATCC 1015]
MLHYLLSTDSSDFRPFSPFVSATQDASQVAGNVDDSVGVDGLGRRIPSRQPLPPGGSTSRDPGAGEAGIGSRARIQQGVIISFLTGWLPCQEVQAASRISYWGLDYDPVCGDYLPQASCKENSRFSLECPSHIGTIVICMLSPTDLAAYIAPCIRRNSRLGLSFALSARAAEMKDRPSFLADDVLVEFKFLRICSPNARSRVSVRRPWLAVKTISWEDIRPGEGNTTGCGGCYKCLYRRNTRLESWPSTMIVSPFSTGRYGHLATAGELRRVSLMQAWNQSWACGTVVGLGQPTEDVSGHTRRVRHHAIDQPMISLHPSNILEQLLAQPTEKRLQRIH